MNRIPYLLYIDDKEVYSCMCHCQVWDYNRKFKQTWMVGVEGDSLEEYNWNKKRKTNINDREAVIVAVVLTVAVATYSTQQQE